LKKYTNEDSTQNLSKNRSFFCSELIASLYKVMKLLPKNIVSSNYWPGSFSCEANLELERNAFLSDEYLIDFESL